MRRWFTILGALPISGHIWPPYAGFQGLAEFLLVSRLPDHRAAAAFIWYHRAQPSLTHE
jgi:hypothetical protein